MCAWLSALRLIDEHHAMHPWRVTCHFPPQEVHGRIGIWTKLCVIHSTQCADRRSAQAAQSLAQCFVLIVILVQIIKAPLPLPEVAPYRPATSTCTMQVG
jgi:hypothetical protein